MPNYDIQNIVGKERQLVTRAFQLVKIIDFTKRTLALNDTADFHLLPGPVLVRNFTPIVITPEGAAATVQLGTSTTPNLFSASLDVNAAAGVIAGPALLNQVISAAYVQAEVQAISTKVDDVMKALGTPNRLHGWYFAANTTLRLTANAAIANAKLLLAFDCVAFDLS